MTYTSEVLDLAADFIQRRGWNGLDTVDELLDPWGTGSDRAPMCVEGALFAASGIDNSVIPTVWGLDPDVLGRICPAYAAVAEYLQLPEVGRLWQWNDARGRTEGEVIEVLRAAAAVQRVKEESNTTKEVAA